VIGSKWQQGYATRLASGEIQVFPLQYNVIERRWVNLLEDHRCGRLAAHRHHAFSRNCSGRHLPARLRAVPHQPGAFRRRGDAGQGGLVSRGWY
jgi:hypothetical protein